MIPVQPALLDAGAWPLTGTHTPKPSRRLLRRFDVQGVGDETPRREGSSLASAGAYYTSSGGAVTSSGGAYTWRSEGMAGGGARDLGGDGASSREVSELHPEIGGTLGDIDSQPSAQCTPHRFLSLSAASSLERAHVRAGTPSPSRMAQGMALGPASRFLGGRTPPTRFEPQTEPSASCQ